MDKMLFVDSPQDGEEATMEENKAVVEQVKVQYEYASSTGEYKDGKDLED